jgi:DNA invertase Pin-like site-specific DNA recombinase
MKYVTYLRCSTREQGQSGLGIEAQRETCERFAEGGAIVAEYMEVESGKRRDRPQLTAALAKCRFVCCDFPRADRVMLHIAGAIAEWERRRISERTRDALAALKRRGRKLGNPANLTTTARERGVQANRRAAERHNERVRPWVRELKAQGLSLRTIADVLNGRGVLTRRGCRWTAGGISRLLA